MEAAIALFIFVVAISFTANNGGRSDVASLHVPEKHSGISEAVLENNLSSCDHQQSRWIERDLTNPEVEMEVKIAKEAKMAKESPDAQ